MANTVEIIIRGSDQASGAFGSVKSGLSGLSGGLKNIGKSLMKTGGFVTAGVTAPLVAMGLKVASVAGEFEASMNVLALAARSSGTSMGDLSKAAIQVGGDAQLVGIDAMQAADAMTTFYKAGLTTNDVFADMEGYLAGTSELTGALRSAVDLAAASDIDLAQASEAVAIAMATFGLNAEDAAAIANSFVGAADASVAEVSDLTEALKNVGPTAASFGYSLEDTNTALAILSTRGIKGSEAGTSLKSMMTNLMRPTAAVTGTLEKLGVELYNMDGSMRNLPEIIGDLSTSMAGMTEEQRLQTIQTLAGTYGMKALATLLDEGAPGWDAMGTAIGEAATAQEVGEARTQGFAAAMEQLQGAIQTFMITAGTPLIQALTPLVQKFGDFIGKLIEADPKILQMGIVIAGLVAAIGPALLVLGAMATGLGLILSPIGLIVVGIALLAAAIATNFLGIRDFFAGIWPKIQAIFETAWKAIKAGFEYVANILVPLLIHAWYTLQAWVKTNWPAIQAIFETVWGAVKSVVETVINAVVPFIVSQFNVVLGWVQANWPLIEKTITTVLSAILSAVQTVLSAVQKFWTEHGKAIMVIVKDAWAFIKLVISSAIKAVLAIIKAIMQIITGDWEGAWETIKTTAETIWANIKALFEPWIQGIQTFLSDALKSISKFWGETWDAVKYKADEVWKAITEGIEKKVKGLVTFLSDSWTSISKSFKDTFEGMVTKAVDFGRGIMESLKEGIAQISIPFPKFEIGWSTGPAGIKIPRLEWGIIWKSLRSLIPAAFAEGGIVTRPTLAIIGEAGPEAVVPLSKRGGQQLPPALGIASERSVQLLTQIRDLLDQLASQGMVSSYGPSDLVYKMATVGR